MHVIRTWQRSKEIGYQFDTGHNAHDTPIGRFYSTKNNKSRLNRDKGQGRKLCPAMDAAIKAYKNKETNNAP